MSEPVILKHAELARRLGVSVHCVRIEIKTEGRVVSISTLVNGKDLTAEQERIARRYFAEVAKGQLSFLPSAGKA